MACASTRTQQSMCFFDCHFFVLHFQGSFFSTSTVSTFNTTSSNMDSALGIASTPNNNTADALVESSPPGAQADPVGDDIQIVGAPENYRREILQEAQEQQW